MVFREKLLHDVGCCSDATRLDVELKGNAILPSFTGDGLLEACWLESNFVSDDIAKDDGLLKLKSFVLNFPEDSVGLAPALLLANIELFDVGPDVFATFEISLLFRDSSSEFLEIYGE